MTTGINMEVRGIAIVSSIELNQRHVPLHKIHKISVRPRHSIYAVQFPFLVVAMEKEAFQSYEKMAESSTGWINGTNKLGQVDWIVTEKVHGANFCFVVSGDGETVRCAKRKEFLNATDDFFHFQQLQQSLSPMILALARLIQTSLLTRAQPVTDAAHLYIFGELFGGAYPHASVAAIHGLQAVQTGVYYSPDIQFYAFDIQIETESGSFFYLDYAESLRLFEAVGNLFYAKPLFKGSYTECLKFGIEFETTIPTLLGYPPIPNNQAEGVVIKPMHELVVMTKKGETRAILKAKATEFLEDARYYQATKWDNSKEKFQSEMEVDSIKWEILALVNENRLACAVSKAGNLSRENKERSREVLQLMSDDVKEEAGELFARLMPHQRASIENDVELQCRILIVERI
jgi:Rnl2 family RNA ligase